MNQFRFNFFFYIIFSYYNEIKLHGLIDIIQEGNNKKYANNKRKFANLYSDTESDDETKSGKKIK